MIPLFRTTVLLALCVVCQPCLAEFAIVESDSQVSILEKGKPVLAYNYGRVLPPAGVDVERYWRSSYIHPLYGLDGEIVTDDFPKDHYHHRGVYWTWPETRVGERRMDVWTIIGARQLFQKWLMKEVTEDHVEIGVQNAWFFDDDPEPKVQETIFFTVHPAEKDYRAIDFRLRFKNVCNEDVSFLGAENKGYGGFSFRPNAGNRPFTFVAADGIVERDALSHETPWASIGWKGEGKADAAGIAIFQHPSNPGFPHPGWIFRHYGFLGVSWPHEQNHILKPGESFELRYRLLVHRNKGTKRLLRDLFSQYVEEEQP